MKVDCLCERHHCLFFVCVRGMIACFWQHWSDFPSKEIIFFLSYIYTQSHIIDQENYLSAASAPLIQWPKKISWFLFHEYSLTHWSSVMYISVSDLNNQWFRQRHPALDRTNTDLLSNAGTNCNEIWIKVKLILWRKCTWKYHPDSKVHVANMGPTWVLSAPGGPHVGPMSLVIRAYAKIHFIKASMC